MVSTNSLALIANPRIADPRAGFYGAQDRNALIALRDAGLAKKFAPGAIGGDANALSRLAGVDPQMALQIDQRNYQRQRQSVADARVADADRRARAAEKTDRIAALLYDADTPEKFNRATQYLSQMGVDTSQLTFDQRESYINDAMTLSDKIKQGYDLEKLLLEQQKVAQAGATGPGTYGLTPIYARDPDGNIIPLQLSKSGTAVRTDTPEGLTVLSPSETAAQRSYGTETGKIQADLPAAKAKAENLLTSVERQWDLVDEKINQALAAIDQFPSTGLIGSAAANIPGTPAFNLSQDLATIKANIGFDKLQEMRNNSPTGGALGQVSNLENELLQATSGSLVQGQTKGKLRENLERIRDLLHGLRADRRKAFNQTFGDVSGEAAPGATGSSPVTIQNDDEYNRLPSGTQFIGPDGQLRVKP